MDLELTKEVIQPYPLARAKYNYSQAEMRVLIYIIKAFHPMYQEQIKINNDTKLYNHPDLFGNHHFKGIKVSDIDKTMHYHSVKNALRSLNDKKITIKTDDYETDARLIEMPKYYEKKGMVDFVLNAEHIESFQSLASGWFFFNPETLFQLNSYGQRFYFLMCQHEDTGIVKIHAKELREILALDENKKSKYPVFSVFKKKVIDRASNELTELFNKHQCKLKFIYDLKLSKSKTKGDDWDRMLHFKVVSIHNDNRYAIDEQKRNKDYENLTYSLSRIYNDKKSYLNELLNFVRRFSLEDMQVLNNRVNRLRSEYINKKISINGNEDAQKLISYILKQEFRYIKKSERTKTNI